MKKLILLIAAATIMFSASAARAQGGMEIYAVPGYAIPTWTGYGYTAKGETSGGLSFGARAYFGSFEVSDDVALDYGAEISYVPLHSWEYTDTHTYGDEETYTYSHTYSIIPVIGQVRYRFGEPGDEAFWYATSGISMMQWRHAYEYPEVYGSWGDYNVRQVSGTNTHTYTRLTASFGRRLQLGDNLIGDLSGRWIGGWALNLTFGVGMMF